MYRLFAALIFASMGSWASAQDSFRPFSVTVNLAARATNSESQNLAGSDKVDDGAYTIDLSYSMPGEEALGDAFGKRFSYFGLRLFQWKDTFTEKISGLEFDGHYSAKGIAALYGRRYFVSREVYKGIGIGWYGGAASMKQEWQFSTGGDAQSKSGVVPVLGAEAFYRIDVWRNVFIEPVLSIAYWKTKAGPLASPIALNLGARF